MQNQSQQFFPAVSQSTIIQQVQEQPVQITLEQQPQMIPQSQPVYNKHETLVHQEPAKKKDKKMQQENVDILTFYKIANRRVAMELDPVASAFQGQITFELELKSEIEHPQTGQMTALPQIIEYYRSQEKKRIHLEAKFLAKQVQVVEVYSLSESPDKKRGENEENDAQNPKPSAKKFKFAKHSLHDPQEQAKQQPMTYQNLSRHLYHLEDVQRENYQTTLKNGTVRLEKRILTIKPQKHDVSKIKKKLWIAINYFCGQITDVGGVRKIAYKRELGDSAGEAYAAQSKDNSKSNYYFATSDHADQSICWMPQILGSQAIVSTWSLKFMCPKEYMIISSGKQTNRVIDQENNALHEYELNQNEMTTADKLGFVCCLFPYITPFDVLKQKDIGFACFLSKQKQSYLGAKLLPEILEFIYNIVQQPYPCRETQVVFLPNLFPLKFPKQSLNFAGGLHLIDQEILFKPSQIDKRHHTYKQITSALTYAYFGNGIREMTQSDLWLMVAVRERLGDRFKKKKCGALLYRYQIMMQIEKLYKQMKAGVETTPLQRIHVFKNTGPLSPVQDLARLGCPEASEQTLNDIFYRKCALFMHMIESHIDEIHLDKILKEMYQIAVQTPSKTLSAVTFYTVFRDVCGMRPKTFFQNWISSTSCPKLELSYEFSKRNNSLDLTLRQVSAASENMKMRKNIDEKLVKIFDFTPEQLENELGAEAPQGNETYNVDQKHAAKRWFSGDINIVIYQVEGSGGDILKQTKKLHLRDFKTTVSAHIGLEGRVKRTMQTRRRDLDSFVAYQVGEQNPSSSIGAQGQHSVTNRQRPGMGNQGAITRQQQAQQMILCPDTWKFEMNEFELEDFPTETKNIFQGNVLDNNPVLWIRVDPDMEYIRKVKVIQEKRNNWLFQLLRENDIVGQIEAVKQLHKYKEELVYMILRAVSSNENFFFKVRKQVLKALHKMEISSFHKHLSHEAFLIKCFNKRNFDEVTNFYKENNFTNLLQYYFDRSLLKWISKCKEERFKLTEQAELELEDLKSNREKLNQTQNMEDADAPPKNQDQEIIQKPAASNGIISLNFNNSSLAGITSKINPLSGRPEQDPLKKDKESERRAKKAQKFANKALDESVYKVTTDKVAYVLLKVLEEGDNSENQFDDSFYIKDILASLGRLDNLRYMYEIACEIYRQFKLDQISNSSPQFAITIGAIKGYYNMRKQIYRFVRSKKSKFDEQIVPLENAKKSTAQYQRGFLKQEKRNQPRDFKGDAMDWEINQVENVLQQMKGDIDRLLLDQNTPLQLRIFIFDEKVKNLFFYSDTTFVKALQKLIEAIQQLMNEQMQIRISFFFLRELVLFLESTRYTGKLNFIDLYRESELTQNLMDSIWELVCLPHGYLSAEFLYWVKRLVNRLYGQRLPNFLEKLGGTLHSRQIDEQWKHTEAFLAKAEQDRATKQEAEKQKNLLVPGQSQISGMGQYNSQIQNSSSVTIPAQQASNSLIQIPAPAQQTMQQSSQISLPMQGASKVIISNSGLNSITVPSRQSEAVGNTQITIKKQPEEKVQNSINALSGLNPQNNTSFKIQIPGTQGFPFQLTQKQSIIYSGNEEDEDQEMVDENDTENMAKQQELKGATALNLPEENKNETSQFSNSIITISRNVKNTGEDSSEMDQQEKIQSPQDESNSQDNEGNVGSDDQQEDDESVYDPFAEEKFQDPDMQRCWLILGILYYHYEATDFLEPVTEDRVGTEFYEEYCQTVTNPMDIGTVMAKMRSHAYRDKYDFRSDVQLIFANCRDFNAPDSEIYNCANNLEYEFCQQWQSYGM